LDPSFWFERWELGQTGFHENVVHRDVQEHVDLLGPRVLVPLCGKSLDLGWLAGQGREVVGVELSEIAARQVLADAEFEDAGSHRALRDGRLTVLVGDIFDATPEAVGTFDAVWDRAALVALDPPRRERYVRTVRSLLKPGGRLLLNFFEYEGTMSGPPFSVPQAEVQAAYGDWSIEVLRDEEDELDERFRARGVTRWTTRLFLVERPA
jgi:thiopurine S-methyltransferase